MVYALSNNYKKYAGAAAFLGGMLGNPQSIPQRYNRGRSYTYTQTKRRKRLTIGTKVKRIVSGMAETKQFGEDDSINMTHETVYTMGCNTRIVKGTGGNNRVGDNVNFKNWHIRFLLNTPTTATGAYSWRIIVFKSPKQNGASTFSTSAFAIADLFVDGTGTNWPSQGQTDPDKITVLYDTTVDVSSQITTTADSQTVDFVVPLNKTKFKYNETTDGYGINFNYYCVIIPHVIGGTTGTTAAGGAIYNTKITFSDM